MGIARSTYYDHPERPADDTAIVEAMFAICDEFEFYGYRRVGAALRQQGIVVNHKKIRRLGRQGAATSTSIMAASPVPNSTADFPINMAIYSAAILIDAESP
ncbi:transposase [Bradyrhizobium sp. BRP14]|nr:IS3 family transposase [Ensifer aridi]MCA1371502.1 transposase [Bradyrhizobium sp. BRP14]